MGKNWKIWEFLKVTLLAGKYSDDPVLKIEEQFLNSTDTIFEEFNTTIPY